MGDNARRKFDCPDGTFRAVKEMVCGSARREVVGLAPVDNASRSVVTAVNNILLHWWVGRGDPLDNVRAHRRHFIVSKCTRFPSARRLGVSYETHALRWMQCQYGL